MAKRLFLPFLLSSLFFSCNSNNNIATPPRSGWLIPSNLVVSGGVGKDGIPSLNNPETISADKADYITDEDLVVGIVVNGQARAYPHAILDWHEVINEDFPNKPLNISYCPLTGTAIVYERIINQRKLNFGISGFLYNSNLIMFDRETDSHWTQMRLQCDQGELVGTKLKVYPSIETSWGAWKKLYSNTAVLSTNTGFNRNYNSGGSVYAMEGYADLNSQPWFIITFRDDRLPPKQRVHGIIFGEGPDNYQTRVYLIDKNKEKRIINDSIANNPVLIIDDGMDNFVISYSRQVNGTTLSFTFENKIDTFPFTLKDNETGSSWNLLGEAIEGPLKGERLEKTLSYNAYWFAWGTFFVGADIYEN